MQDVAYCYCTNVTEEKKLEVDKQVQKNKLEFKCAICLPFIGFLMGQVLFFPVEGLLAQQIVRNARNLSEPANEHNLNKMDEVILVKDYEILPGADGFPLNNNPRRRHPFGRPRMRGTGINVDPPQNIQGLGNSLEAPKVRSFREVDTGLNARRGNRGDQCPAPEFDMKKEYGNFIQEISEKGYELECS
jgi:hypothetical protein